MGCGTKCLKTLLIIVNIIFFLAGAAILGVGIYMLVNTTLYQFKGDVTLSNLQSSLYTGAYILIAFGGFTFIVGFCGCCGAIKDSKCLLGTYIFLVLLILAAEVAGGVFAYVKKDSLLEGGKSITYSYVHDTYTRNNETANVAWNFVMMQFECCGINSYADFGPGSKFYNDTKLSVPQACCVQKDGHKADSQEFEPVDLTKCRADGSKSQLTKSDYLYTAGCYSKLEGFIKDNSVIILGVAGGIAGFEVLVLIAAIAFCCNMDKDD